MTDDKASRELRALLASIEEAGWDYARVEMDGVTLVVSTDPDAGREASPAAVAAPADLTPTPTPEPAAPDAVPDAEDLVGASTGDLTGADLATVTSPSIGLFWRSPKPGAPPFVEVGQTVAATDTICIVEVMKLMTHVQAGEAGTIARIHVKNGDMVEFGTPLAEIARP